MIHAQESSVPRFGMCASSGGNIPLLWRACHDNCGYPPSGIAVDTSTDSGSILSIDYRWD